jgi:cytochrome c oxidase subunit II
MNLSLSNWLSSGTQSALNPAGTPASNILNLWLIFLAVAIVVFLIVVTLLVISLVRSKNENSDVIVEPDPYLESRMKKTVIAGVIATTLILFGLLVTDSFTERQVYTINDPKPLKIKIRGTQWWWEVKYQDDIPANIVTTANEIHVPVNKAVKFELESNDVIHSFWVPNLNGKKDLIPGHPTSTWFKADHEGVYKGQCAEYCGHQHAHMRMFIVAEDQKTFLNWLNHQRKEAKAPDTDLKKHGQQVFLNGPCVMCHTIQGTVASATVGPNLTHVGSRKTIASASFSNTMNHLSQWITDPQKLKPGVKMPQNRVNQNDLNALVQYLKSLD